MQNVATEKAIYCVSLLPNISSYLWKLIELLHNRILQKKEKYIELIIEHIRIACRYRNNSMGLAQILTFGVQIPRAALRDISS